MKKYLFIFLVLNIFNLQSQNFVTVDSIVNKYPKRFSKPENLAELINKDFNNDVNKVRAIYSWCINNIAYEPKEFGLYSYEYSNDKEKKAKEKKYIFKLSKRVISKNIAVCEGYSILFKRLCDLLSITSSIVNGASKTNIRDISRRYNSNHSWNVVKIDNEQYLIDVTWGAGSYSNGFKKAPSYYYFLTEPKLFIKNHYPDNYKYALLDEKIDKKTFLNRPVMYSKKSSIDDVFFPKKGVLEMSKNDFIKFKLLWTEELNSINYLIGRKHNVVQDYKLQNNILEFSIIKDKSLRLSKELIIYINNKPFLGYKLK